MFSDLRMYTALIIYSLYLQLKTSRVENTHFVEVAPRSKLSHSHPVA